jgi:putative transcriptional regulator
LEVSSPLKALLAPGFLIASPRLDGGTFERAVILVAHHDEAGTMGFIVNKPLTVNLGELLETADDSLPGPIASRCFELAVQFGGPVRMEQLWLVYNDESEHGEPPATIDDLEERGHLEFAPRWRLIADSESIESFLYGRRDDAFRPFIGYTGWGAGQLEEEMEEGSWLHLPFDASLIFEDRDQDDVWEDALARIGVDPFAFLMMGGLVKS